MRVKFCVLEQTQVVHLHAKLHLNVFIVSASGGQKPQYFGQFFLQFYGLLHRPPFTDKGKIWCAIAHLRYTLKCQNSSWSSLFYRPLATKTPMFAVFGLRHLMPSPIGSNLRKLNKGAQVQTFPYPKPSKSLLYSKAFLAKSGAQSLRFKNVTNRQTYRQKTQRFGRPGGGWNPSSTKLCMVIEDLEHVRAPLKLLGVWDSFTAMKRWKFGGTKHPQLITSITP